MINEDQNDYYILLQNLNSPQKQKFERANEIVIQLIMDNDQNFLEGIIDILLNFTLEPKQSFIGLAILKEYFKKSIVFDKFHDSVPKSSYSDSQIQIFQDVAYHFFSSKESFLRNNAVDLYMQAFKANSTQELALVPEMIEKLSDNSIQFEETLAIIECFCFIFSEFILIESEEALFPILLDLLSQFSNNDDFNSLFYKVLSKFSYPVFHLITEIETLDNFVEITIKFYEDKIELKNDIINFLQSSCIETEFYNEIVEKILPLIYEDLANFESLSSDIVLTILIFINSDLMIKYPDMIEIFFSQFLTVILNISQSFSLDHAPEFYEWEVFTVAQEIIISLLSNDEKDILTTIFDSISPFIEEGLLSDDLHQRSVSMNFLSYAISNKNINFEYISQTITLDMISECLVQSIDNQFSRVRFYAYQLLNSSYKYVGLDVAIQFIDDLFKSVFDCEPIAVNAIQILEFIGMDKEFTLLDQYFECIQEILNIDQLMNQSTILPEFANLLIFPIKHKEYAEPVIQFTLNLMEQTMSVPEELTNSVDIKMLHLCCMAFVQLIPHNLSRMNEDEIKNIFDLCLSMYNRYLVGTELYIICFITLKCSTLFLDQLQTFVELIDFSFSNAENIYFFNGFVSFALYLETTFDLSQFEINTITSFIELFNETKNFDIKKAIVLFMVQLADMKISSFTEENIQNLMYFLIDLSENVYNIVPTFFEESFDFYKNICILFEKLIKISEFNENPKSFEIVNQLIAGILDFEELAKAILDKLSILFKSFSSVYETQLNDLIQNQEVYREKYMLLDQAIKQFIAGKHS